MSDDSTFGEDPFGFTETNQPTSSKTSSANSVELDKVADALIAKQEAFRRLASTLYDLWMLLPNINTRKADPHIARAYEQLLDLAPFVGVSRNGLPELRECCGKKRVWPKGMLGDPDSVLSGSAMSPFYVAAAPEEPLGWWPGDLIRRVSKLLGFKYCEKCDKRRRAINRFFGKRD